MNNFKKIITLFISILLINLYLLPANASGSGQLSLSSANGKQGETVTLDVGVTNNPGLITMKFNVSWDDGVELVSVSNSGLISGWTAPAPTIKSPYILRWADSLAMENNTANGKIATLTFKIKNNASIGQKNITLNFLESRDANGGQNSFLSVTAHINVNCSTHNYGSYTNVNANSHKRICSECGYEETTGHTWNGGTVTKQATCKEGGTKHFTCNACNATKDETITKTNNHSWGGWNTTKQAGCTTPGTATKTCSVCGKTETQQINATGHSMGLWSQSKAPTCTENGEEKRICSKCGHSETRVIDALGHSFSNPTVTKQPTCTETGVESGKCTRCGQTTTNVIKAKGHKFGNWEDVKSATCTEGGTKERKCTACGTAETKTTDALGHDFENPTIVKEPTISTTGIKEGKCKRCGESTSEVIPCTAKDETTGTVFEANEGVFAAGTELNVEEIKTDNPAFESTKNVLKDVCKEFKLYSISAVLNGADVQPNGEVKTTFNIPEGFGKDIALYAVKADGTSEKIDCEISEDGKTLTAKISALGDYAICKLDDSEEVDNNTVEDGVTLKKSEKSKTVIYIIIAICAVIVVGGVTAFIIIKKKKYL